MPVTLMHNLVQHRGSVPPLHRTPLLRLAGLLWLLAGATYLASETIAAAAFPGDELTQLVFTIAGINTWNRMMIAEAVATDD